MYKIKQPLQLTEKSNLFKYKYIHLKKDKLFLNEMNYSIYLLDGLKRGIHYLKR